MRQIQNQLDQFPGEIEKWEISQITSSIVGHVAGNMHGNYFTSWEKALIYTREPSAGIKMSLDWTPPQPEENRSHIAHNVWMTGCRAGPGGGIHSGAVETEALCGQETKHCGDPGRQGMEEQALL